MQERRRNFLKHSIGWREALARKLRQLREYLLDLVADIEAAIDFADDFTPDSVPVVNINEDAIGPKIHYVYASSSIMLPLSW